jgi:hypothetical protein
MDKPREVHPCPSKRVKLPALDETSVTKGKMHFEKRDDGRSANAEEDI